jgi:hypothetical protein
MAGGGRECAGLLSGARVQRLACVDALVSRILCDSDPVSPGKWEASHLVRKRSRGGERLGYFL